ncbi:hypothetical protein CROQUDRAFT_661790 [Cronartium quercuum f. sp. fusiforme G11]|uniref:Glycoside hydrolase family 36 protein n=1 Tax=Cronartium quercuum f. sp. fusiforme G11 TaxID=708437 RepID=A0A9P6NEY9_9BASI|nr:hypothetical protein CROQUDRAFT_661790 [Cronartium quercuum f. sp. fusiforme G11]
MTFSFNPALGSIIHLQPCLGSDHCELNFYAHQNLQDRGSSTEVQAKVPQIWTEARLSNESDDPTPIWKAVIFSKVQDQSLASSKTNALLWQAKLSLKAVSGVYGFTYRLAAPTVQPDEETGVEWLGSTGDNGQIRVHVVQTSNWTNSDGQKNVSENRLLDGFRATASDDVITHYPLGITTHLFSFPLTSKPIEHGTSSSVQQTILSIGELEYEAIEGLVYERSKPTCFNPRGITALSQISQTHDCQAIVFRRPSIDNLAIVLFPLSSEHQSSTFRANSDSKLLLCSSFDSGKGSSEHNSQVAVTIGPEWALQQLFGAAVDNFRYDRPQSSTLHKLRYCTRNSFGPRYRFSDVSKALDDFEESKLAILIDGVLLWDGWQDVNGQMLSGWDAQKYWVDFEPASHQNRITSDGNNGLPERELSNHNDTKNGNLSSTVRHIRQSGRGNIKHVGVWITLNGYWEGLDPESDTMKKFDLRRWLVRRSEDLSSHPQAVSTWHLPSLACMTLFWDEYFNHLKSAGIDFVQVDNQASLDYVFQCESHPSESAHSLRSTMFTSMVTSAHRIFQTNPVMHCMAYYPQIWGCRPPILSSMQELTARSESWVMKTSNEISPDESDDKAHRLHIVSNALNSLFASAIGFSPDFDMLMTRHSLSAYHAALRVMSPSPIFITVGIGRHDMAIFRKLTAPLKAGGSAVVQSSGRPGTILAGRCMGQDLYRITEDCTGWGLLKIGLSVGNVGGALIGIWNVNNSNTSDTSFDLISKRDISEAFGVEQAREHHLEQGKESLAIYSRNQRTFTIVYDFDHGEEIKRSNHMSGSVMGVSLRKNMFEILTISRLWSIPHTSGIRIATFGLLEPIAGLIGIKRAGVRSFDSSQPLNQQKQNSSKYIHTRHEKNSQATENNSSNLITKSFTPSGRLRYVFSYLFMRDQMAYKHLSSLLHDSIRSPICTIFSESLAIARMSFSLARLIIYRILSLFLPRSGGDVNQRLTRDASNDSDQVSVEEASHDDMDGTNVPLLNSSKQTSGSPSSTALRFKTAFTGQVGFGLVIDSGLGKKFKDVRDSVVLKVDGEVVESALDFEKMELNDFSYLVTLDLEKFAQTHMVEPGETEWLIEVEGVGGK